MVDTNCALQWRVQLQGDSHGCEEESCEEEG
jgi:hypothetical protein